MKRRKDVKSGPELKQILICANCSESCSRIVGPNDPIRENYVDCVDEILLQLNQRNSINVEKITVKNVLSSIFKLKIVYELNLDGNDKKIEKTPIVLCRNCSELLQSMFMLFDAFNHLRKAGSYLDKKIIQLDDIFTQLQETWSEMAKMTDEMEDDEQKVTQPSPTKNSGKCGHNLREEDEEEEEVMIIDEQLEKNSVILANARSSPIKKMNNSKDIQQQLPASSSSFIESKKVNVCSTLEQRILSEITKPSTTILDDRFSNSGAEIHFENDAEMDFEDETEQDLTQNDWEDDTNEIIGLPYESDNSTSNFLYNSSRLSSETPSSSDHYQDRSSRSDYLDLELDNKSDDSDWRLQRSPDKRKGQRTKPRTPRIRRKPLLQSFEYCPICTDSITFDNPKEKSDHFLDHHSSEQFKTKPLCLLCNKIISTFYSLKTHLKGHAAYYPFTCSVSTCHRSFLTMQQLEQHICVTESVNSEPGQSGQGSSLKLPTPKNFKQPTKSNLSTKPKHVPTYTMCPLCPPDETIKCPMDLSQHFMKAHRRTPDDTNCQVCLKKFSAPAALMLHYRSHARDLRWKCANCEKDFLTKMQLEKHYCPTTGKVITNSDMIRITARERVRSELVRKKKVKVYKNCPLCPSKPTFDYPSDLSHHWWTIHVPASNITNCPLCDKKVAQATYLRLHLKTHANDMKWTCPDTNCGVSFVMKQQLHLHIAKHHPGLPNQENAINFEQQSLNQQLELEEDEIQEIPIVKIEN